MNTSEKYYKYVNKTVICSAGSQHTLYHLAYPVRHEIAATWYTCSRKKILDNSISWTNAIPRWDKTYLSINQVWFSRNKEVLEKGFQIFIASASGNSHRISMRLCKTLSSFIFAALKENKGINAIREDNAIWINILRKYWDNQFEVKNKKKKMCGILKVSRNCIETMLSWSWSNLGQLHQRQDRKRWFEDRFYNKVWPNEIYIQIQRIG